MKIKVKSNHTRGVRTFNDWRSVAYNLAEINGFTIVEVGE